MLPFYPKLAAESDAPEYTSISMRDEKCEECRFFRALATGGGYCEKFSFHAAPDGVCDDYSRVDKGQLKQSSAPVLAPAAEELKQRRDYAKEAVKGLARGRISKDTVLAAARAAETSRTANFIKLVDVLDQSSSKKS